MNRRILAATLTALLALFLVRCSGGGDTVFTELPMDTAAETTAEPDTTDVAVGPEEVATPDVVQFDVQEVIPSDVTWEPGPGEAGYECSDDDDCNSGFCIQTADGLKCTQFCEDECPFDWQCVEHTPSLPDQVLICVPRFVDLCRPCGTNTDCWTDGVDGGQSCVSYGPAGFFCGEECATTEDCPSGYDCLVTEDVAGSLVSQCVRADGECACTQRFIDAQAGTECYQENEFGLCAGQRACMGEGLTDCDAPEPQAESCNDLDDDCDGLVDEDTSGDECLIENQYGACPGLTSCVGGQVKCEGDAPQPEICDGIDNNCNGQYDEGFPDTNGDGIKDCLVSDKDGDGVLDVADNCPSVANVGQADFDLDGSGDACDLDDDNDLVADGEDCAPFNPDVSPDEEELCNGIDDDCDLVVDEGFPDSDYDKLADCIDNDDDNDGKVDEIDCAPFDPDTYPGAEELCDGIDNDCDENIDEDFPDGDDDGIADCVDEDVDGDGVDNDEDNCPALANPEQEDQDQDDLGDLCDKDLDGDAIPNALDNCPSASNTTQSDLDQDGMGDSCDEDIDGDGAVNDEDNCLLIANPEQADGDGNGIGDACEADMDGDGVVNEDDCAPLNPDVYPGAEELCDELDNDCDLVVDEGFPDSDLDGLKDCVDGDDDNDGDPDETDCAPLNGAIHQAAAETCDNIDNNCNGEVDEGLGSAMCGVGECAHQSPACVNGMPGVCNPFAGAAVESCDGKDNDCDGLVDEDLGTLSCGLGVCAQTMPVCVGGELQECDPLVGAGEEVCDGKDNDCDGQIDEEQPTLACGQGQCFHTIASCVGGVSFECNAFDGAGPEVCDGVDNDCDGDTDEDLGTIPCGLGECAHEAEYCIGGKVQSCNPFLGAQAETCDTKDNDCDGLVDEELGMLSCGLGQCAKSVAACIDGVAQECNPLDGAEPEQCDGLDNDCDGDTDEELGTTTCGVGECLHVSNNCQDGQPAECNPMEGAIPEMCDGLDNDCDGEPDDGLGETTCGLGACLHTVANCQDGQSQICNPLEGLSDETCDGIDNDCDGDTDEGFPDFDGDDSANCVDDDDDGDGDPDDSDCAPLDPTIGSTVDEVCMNGIDDDCNPFTSDLCGPVSCYALHESDPTLPSGTYTIDPTGGDAFDAYAVECDMTTDGGGWNVVNTVRTINVGSRHAYKETTYSVTDYGYDDTLFQFEDVYVNFKFSGELDDSNNYINSYFDGNLISHWKNGACNSGFAQVGSWPRTESVNDTSFLMASQPEGDVDVDCGTGQPYGINQFILTRFRVIPQ